MTDTTVIQPGAGQAILTTDHHDDRRGRYGYDDCHRELRTDADYRSLVAQAERYGTINGDRINSGVQVTGDRVNAVGAAAAAAACRTNELVQSGFGAVHDRLCDATGKVIHEIDRHGDASALAACKLADGIADVKFHGMETAKDQIIAQNVGFAAQSTLSTTIGNAANVLATSIGNQLGNQATSNFNLLTVQLERTRAELAAQSVAGFNAVQLKLCECCHETQQGFQAAQAQADRHFASLQAQQDRNACDIKQLIVSDGNTTRALVNEIESRRKDEVIRALQTQVLLGGGVPARAA